MKITLNKEEETELTPREEEIYRKGVDDGKDEWAWFEFCFGLVICFVTISIFINSRQ